MRYRGRVNSETQKEFLSSIGRFPETLRIMCLNIWVTGSRVSEVCTITGGDYSYNGEEAWLTVMQHKVSHRKTVPIPNCLYELMVDYIAGNGIEAGEYVFKGSSGQPYDAFTFRALLQHYNNNQGNGYVFRPHECRRRIVTEMMEDGVSVDEIGEFLGQKQTID